MPILRLIAEGVGPFERLDLDLSGGEGKPHYGPHILAGVNGSGKSTVLRAIAAVRDVGRHGFPYDQWAHLTSNRPRSACLLSYAAAGESVSLMGVRLKSGEDLRASAEDQIRAFSEWTRCEWDKTWSVFGVGLNEPFSWQVVRTGAVHFKEWCAGYAPTRSIRFIPAPSPNTAADSRKAHCPSKVRLGMRWYKAGS
jgi:hypothetical protein